MYYKQKKQSGIFMKKFIFILLGIIFASSVTANTKSLSYAQLENIVKEHNGKTVAIFWATYCPYCKKELEMIISNYDYFKAQKIKILGISIEKSAEVVTDFAKSKEYPFDIYMITENLKEKLNIRVVPITAIYDESGNMEDISPGCKNFEELKNMISN